MKLIIKEYLASLRERDELDAIIPDLLSELGLTVLSRPSRGPRQDGVDVAAVGSLDGGEDKVYLFSIKERNLTRSTWDSNSPQCLRASLNQILDAFIPNRLPQEHRSKKIVICLCFGGDIQEPVRPDVTGYIKSNQKNNISFEEWNGDKLASLILTNFLQEDLIPELARSQLRKSLALLDEPDASYGHFSILVRAFSNLENKNENEKLKAIRQIAICLWILYAWAREAENLESAYLSSEFSLLHAWSIVKPYMSMSKQNKTSEQIQETYFRILHLYLQITDDFVDEKVIPYVTKKHALSIVARGSDSLDINLKLFDIVGRLALNGTWAYWFLSTIYEDPEDAARLQSRIIEIANSVKYTIANNPILLLPVQDSQVIDISATLLLLMADSDNRNIISWLENMVERAEFAFLTCGLYPCNLDSYVDLLEHPQPGDEYRQKVTVGSVLFPMIALVAALLNHEELYKRIQAIKREYLSHCNFQFWYPDDSSEEHLYQNSGIHGATLSHVRIDLPMDKFIEQVFGECEESPQFDSLSAVQYNQWPLVLVACRHYRLPIPLHLWKSLWESRTSTDL